MKNMFLTRKRFRGNLVKDSAHILYHVVVISLSAGFALSLPLIVNFVATNFLVYWSWIGNEKIFLIFVEMALAIWLILLSNYISRSWKDRRLSKMAREAGLMSATPAKGFFARRKNRKLKERQGFSRDVMLIGSTGFRTFVDPKGDLYHVIQNCREARIMLLDPYSEGASARAKSILDPNVTPETFEEQILTSIDYLRGLKAIQKKIRLKLYQEPPFLKLTILGDYIWIQHYHAGLDVQRLPKYLFKHDPITEGLYTPFYQYFHIRWNNPAIPEYDLDTDELVYGDRAGNGLRREKFNKRILQVNQSDNQGGHRAEGNSPFGDSGSELFTVA
jgi:hypothetical protein